MIGLNLKKRSSEKKTIIKNKIWVIIAIYSRLLALIPARCRGLFFIIKNILKNKN
jgi:hypothetical protein